MASSLIRSSTKLVRFCNQLYNCLWQAGCRQWLTVAPFKETEKMNIFAEVELRSNNGTEHLMEQINKFCNRSTNWCYKEVRKNISSKNHFHLKVCDLIYSGSNRNPRFPFYEKKEGHMYVANILSKLAIYLPLNITLFRNHYMMILGNGS